jgi:hypothetical protein
MVNCGCRCHVYGAGAYASCDVGAEQPGGQRSCTTEHHDLDGDVCVLAHAEPVERFIGLVCRAHYHRIADTLREIEELFALLPDVLEPRSSSAADAALRHGVSSGLSALSSGSRVDSGAQRRGLNAGSKRAHSPAPGRLAAMAVTDRRDPTSPRRVLEAWLVEVHKHRGGLTRWVAGRGGLPEREHDALRHGRLPLTTITKTLHAERRWLAGQEWIAAYVAALEDVHHQLATAVGVTMWPEPIGTCPNCQAKLYPKPTGGVDEVTCRKCKTTWRGVHLARLRLIHEQEQSA